MNHGSSISHAGFLTTTDVFALSHDENFSICKLETDPECPASEEPPKVFGDLRPRLSCDYVVDVIASIGFSECEAIIGAGSNRYADIQTFFFHYFLTITERLTASISTSIFCLPSQSGRSKRTLSASLALTEKMWFEPCALTER